MLYYCLSSLSLSTRTPHDAAGVTGTAIAAESGQPPWAHHAAQYDVELTGLRRAACDYSRHAPLSSTLYPGHATTARLSRFLPSREARPSGTPHFGGPSPPSSAPSGHGGSPSRLYRRPLGPEPLSSYLFWTMDTCRPQPLMWVGITWCSRCLGGCEYETPANSPLRRRPSLPRACRSKKSRQADPPPLSPGDHPFHQGSHRP